VAFFRDNSWGSQRDDVRLSDYPPNDRHSLPSGVHDKATWVGWNLPVGEVVTLMEHVVKDAPNGLVSDLGRAGVCVELVGTGKPESVNLIAIDLNDKVSCFFYRTAKFALGAIELFGDANFSGPRSTLFLSEWEADKLFNFKDWWLQDRVSSARWITIGDRCKATLYDNTDGQGDRFVISSATSGPRETSNFRDIRLNDRFSAWKWSGLKVMKEVIDPFQYIPPEGGSWKRYNTDMAGVTSAAEVEVEDTVSVTTVREIKTTTTDQHVAGVQSTWTTEASAGLEGLGEVKTSFSVQLNYQYTWTKTEEKTEQKTVTSEQKVRMKVPPRHRFRVVVDVLERELKDEVLTTQTTRWYEEYVEGGVQDPSQNYWYKRVEPVEVKVSGTLATRFRTEFLVEEVV
jgi:hypothetical protein